MTTKIRHPMQPVIWDGKGVVRFQPNPIVQFLLKFASDNGCTLNELAYMSEDEGWTRNDWEHFAQLHGYSVSGWGSLSYVRDATWERAEAKQRALLERQPTDPGMQEPKVDREKTR